MTALMVLSLLVVAGILLLVLVTVVSKGWRAVTANFPHGSPDISASKIRAGGGCVRRSSARSRSRSVHDPRRSLGIAGAVYLNEYGKRSPFANAALLTNVMAGVPSIVMGLFIYVIWVVPLGRDGSPGSAVAGARLPDAAGRGALDRGDAQARAATPA